MNKEESTTKKPHIVLDTDEPQLCHWCKGPIAGESEKIVRGMASVNYLRVYHPTCYEESEIPF